MSEAPVTRQEEILPEDQARADFYALLARLFADAPDPALLAAIAGAAPLVPVTPVEGQHTPDLAGAWDALRAASAAVDPAAAADEHQALFVGVGRSAVSPHASYYLAPQSGRLLAELRTALARLGLARRPETSEYEDHLAVLLETMRFLAVGDAAVRPAPIDEQRAFFERYLVSWVFDCCIAIDACPIANYYRAVAQFTQHFLALERDSFAME
jgi:TorA maturation chaperone TorD